MRRGAKSNFKTSEASVIPFDPTRRVGSSTVGNGARRSILDEPLTRAEEYPIEWRELRVDLAELAKLRWIEGLSRKELAERYGRTEMAVQNYFQALRRKNFCVVELSVKDRRQFTLEAGNLLLNFHFQYAPCFKAAAIKTLGFARRLGAAPQALLRAVQELEQLTLRVI